MRQRWQQGPSPRWWRRPKCKRLSWDVANNEPGACSTNKLVCWQPDTQKKGPERSSLFCLPRTFGFRWVFLHSWRSSVSAQELAQKNGIVSTFKNSRSLHLVWADCDFIRIFFFTKQHWIMAACAPDPTPADQTPPRFDVAHSRRGPGHSAQLLDPPSADITA